MRQAILVLLLLLTPMTKAYGTLWDIAVTGYAEAGGTQGLETVIYRYDPSEAVYTTPCGVSIPLGTLFCNGGNTQLGETVAPIKSVLFSGIVNGAAGPAILRAWSDTFAPYLDLGGSSISEAGAMWPGFFLAPEPVRLVVGVAQIGSLGGGEGDFRWLDSALNPPPPSSFRYIVDIAPTRLSSPSTLALTLLVLLVLLLDKRGFAMRRASGPRDHSVGRESGCSGR